MAGIVRYFIDRPLLVNLLMFLFIIAGIASFNSARFNTYPDIDNGKMVVETYYHGAGAEDIELKITTPLERELVHVDGVRKVISNSMEGLSTIRLEADPNGSSESYELIEKDIRSAIDRVLGELPNDMQRLPEVRRPESTRNFSLMQVVVTGTVSELKLQEISRIVRREMRNMPGVAGIDRSGYRQREIKLFVDELKIRQLGLTYQQIITAVNNRNVSETGGSIESVVGEQEVLAVGKFENPKEIADVILFQGEVGDVVRLGDVARLSDGFEEPRVRSRYNGAKAIILLPRADENADRMGVAQRIRHYVEQKQQTLPAGVNLVIVDDSAVVTRQMLDVLKGNAAIGIALVALVLLCFFRWRFALWVVLGIPTAVLMVFIVMPYVGITVNLLSMSALILMLGILVDDAVVVAESIFRQKEYGLPAREAAFQGVMKVLAPILAATVTTIVMLAPMAFLGGIQGKFMWIVPLMAILVLLMSLIECKLFLPSHIAHAFEGGSTKRLSRSWFERIEDAYESFMMFVVPHRYLFSVIVLLIFLGLGYFGFSNIVVATNPDADVDSVFVKVEGPVDASFEQMEARLLAMESKVRATIPEEVVEDVLVTVGHHDHNTRKITEGQNVSWGLISVYLKENNQRDIHSREIAERIRQRLGQEQGLRRLNVIVNQLGPSMGLPLEAVVISNSDNRFAVADKILSYVESIEGVTESWSDYVTGKPVVSLEIDYVALSRFGLSVADISEAISIAYNGTIIDTYDGLDEKIHYRLMLDAASYSDISGKLASLTVTNAAGETILLRSLVEFRQKPGEGTIYHYRGDRATTVYAEIDRQRISLVELNRQVSAYVDSLNLQTSYPDVSVYFDGELVTSKEQAGQVLIALAFGLFVVLIILVLLFKSFLQPFMVLALIPLGVISVFVVFVLHGLQMTLVGMVGLAGLMGVIVNDAVVMLDRFNVERDRNGAEQPLLLHDRQIVECASLRLRPIVITTVTTCAGLLPAAYGLYGSYDLITPMILVMFWGVLIASTATLFFLPALYAFERDLQVRLYPERKRQTLDEVIMYN